MSEHNSSRGGSGALFGRINGESQIARRVDSFQPCSQLQKTRVIRSRPSSAINIQ